MSTTNLVKIVDHSVYGNLVSGIIYSIFTLLFLSKLTYRKSDKKDMDITYQITYFLLAAMFLVFIIEYIFKYRFDHSFWVFVFSTLKYRSVMDKNIL